MKALRQLSVSESTQTVAVVLHVLCIALYYFVCAEEAGAEVDISKWVEQAVL